VGRPRLEPRSLNSGPSGFSIVLRPRVTSWNDLVCLSKGLILPTFLTLETGRTRRFSPDGPPLIRKQITCNNMLLCTFFLQIPSTQEKRSYLLHSWLPVTGGGGGALLSAASTYVGAFVLSQGRSLRSRCAAWARAHAHWGQAPHCGSLVSPALSVEPGT